MGVRCRGIASFTSSILTGIVSSSNASTWRCRRLVHMGLSLAHQVLDAPLPETVRRAALGRFRCRRCSPTVCPPRCW